MDIQIPKNVAPSGFPTCRSSCVSAKVTSRLVSCSTNVSLDADTDDDCVDESLERESEVLRRKSWVTATPMLAKEREVRSQARKVRSMYCQ